MDFRVNWAAGTWRYSLGTHQVQLHLSLVLLKLSPTPVDTIFDRAADRTCRLGVFKEVHLVLYHLAREQIGGS